MSLSEFQECVELATWLNRREICYTHIPNGGLRNPREAASFKRMGVQRGVPDYLIFDQPPNFSDRYKAKGLPCGIALEMKRVGGTERDTSKMQAHWLRMLHSRGWITLVCFGAKDAIAKLVELGYDD